MDEIFHIPQAQKYCAYNFSSWDPMITTLPGLYLAAVSLLQPLASLQGIGLLEICTTFNLRVVNIIFASGNFVLLFFLSSKLNGSKKELRKEQSYNILHALVLVLFPVLYFFTWMFYTDHGSAFFTLLMYFCSLSGKHRVASIAGIAAILFRQTNVIWVVFCLGLNKAQVLEEQLALDKKVRGNINNMKDTEVIKIMFKTTFSSVSRTLSIVTAILKRTFWYLCVILGFVVFVFLNKGIVVGDRGLLWRICYVVCVFASLVPHSLLEFRYFIIPFYVLRLNMKPPCTKLLVVELLMYVVINAATIFMFVKRPFYWPEVNTAQRFMW
ncbi:hypothetical protein RRG08_038156 [Elysia crispata]|uniref:Dol-P-Glc:Glc(2)Man(9)GlcNAc(2)-PP-Dol alpha-1,2-glucosyltransferase n=1 Tax=Elysia crispata TaxID=231223 RepID=A0AAE0YS96_9GAST|nr:hypothetical protein RRG08_038156 [Elysia crispata]